MWLVSGGRLGKISRCVPTGDESPENGLGGGEAWNQEHEADVGTVRRPSGFRTGVTENRTRFRPVRLPHQAEILT